MRRLTGKIALVSGAARGIGEAIAKAFVAEGAYVYLTDIDESNGRLAAEKLSDRARFESLDVREEEDWRRVIATVRPAWPTRRPRQQRGNHRL
ncbi:MAG: SDR family NAD(P)-dependent oxidoreductase [Methylocella sp.]